VIQRQPGGVKLLAVSLPCRYIHTANCVGNRTDIEEMKKLLFLLSAKLPTKGCVQ